MEKWYDQFAEALGEIVNENCKNAQEKSAVFMNAMKDRGSVVRKRVRKNGN